jgi:hypothetical protein
MNLKPFVGKFVVVNLKPGESFLVNHANNERPRPMMIKIAEGQQAPVLLPFCMGEVIFMEGGVAGEPQFGLRYTEQDVLGPSGDPNRKYVTVLDPARIAEVTYVVEQRVHLIGQP